MLAANDPAGQWEVGAQERFSGTKGSSAAFNYAPVAQVGVPAGATQRAVFSATTARTFSASSG
ncbi:MAG: hypothetical protein WKG07_33790 [Hymenobacter sp.]